jgi:hypothetical protein
MIRYLMLWREWAAFNTNSSIHKFLVLIGLVKSPTFERVKNYYNDTKF